MSLIQTNSLGSLNRFLRKVLLAVIRILYLTNCIISAAYKSSIFPTIPYIELILSNCKNFFILRKTALMSTWFDRRQISLIKQLTSPHEYAISFGLNGIITYTCVVSVTSKRIVDQLAQ